MTAKPTYKRFFTVLLLFSIIAPSSLCAFVGGYLLGIHRNPKPQKQLAPIVFIDTTKAKAGAVWMRCEDSKDSPLLDTRKAVLAVSDSEKHVQAIQFEACP